MTKLVDINRLANFKEKQDAANAEKFMQVADFVDGEGKIKAEKISTEEIIKMHVDASDAENVKYFADENGEKSAVEISGEIGKIYVDLESGGKIIYTSNGENFIPFVSEIATDADIENLFNE